MIESEIGNCGDERALDHVGRIEAPSETHFQNAGIGRSPRKGEERNGRRHFKEAWLDPGPGVDHLFERLCKLVVVDEPSGNPDPLVEADEMRARESVYASAARLERSSKECDGRALSVRSSNVEQWGKPILGPAEPFQQ